MANKDFNPGYNWHRGNQRSQKPSKGKSGGSSGPQYDGGLSKAGKIIIGGLAIYVAGSLGLGWVTDTIDNVQSAIEVKNEIKEAAKKEKADNKESAKAEKKLKDDMNYQGYTDKFDLSQFELEAGDVADILSEIEEVYSQGKGIDIAKENTIYVDNEVFENSANYRAAIINRIHLYEEPVAFATVYHGLSEKKMEEIYDDVAYIKSSNLDFHHPVFNMVHQQGIMGNDRLIVVIAFYNTGE